MSWLRIESNFVKHPKVGRLSALLDISKGEAGWLIMSALSWFSQFRPTGQVEGQHRDSDAASLEDFCEWTGPRGRMLRAFITAELIDDTPETGGFEYHSWPEYQGKVKASAEKERQRKADYRARKAAEKAAREAELSRGTSSGTKAGRPALRNGTGRDGTERSSSYEDDEAPSSPGERFFEWFQEQRFVGFSFVREKSCPSRADLDQFVNDAAQALEDTPDGAIEGLKVAFEGYSKDKYWIPSALPWNGFVTQWHRHVMTRGPRIDRSESQEGAPA